MSLKRSAVQISDVRNSLNTECNVTDTRKKVANQYLRKSKKRKYNVTSGERFQCLDCNMLLKHKLGIYKLIKGH